MSNDRFSKLGKRIYGRQQHEESQEKEEKSRRRYTIYIDKDLITRLNEEYKLVNHEFFPAEIQKSFFLETLFQYGLDRMEEIKEAIKGMENSTSAS